MICLSNIASLKVETKHYCLNRQGLEIQTRSASKRVFRRVYMLTRWRIGLRIAGLTPQTYVKEVPLSFRPGLVTAEPGPAFKRIISGLQLRSFTLYNRRLTSLQPG